MNESIERWRAVVEFEGLYEVSDRGRVRSVERWVPWSGGGRCLRPSVIMKLQFVDTPGRGKAVRVSLRRNGRYYRRSVHVLVAEAFIGPRPSPAHDCCHWDGDPENNWRPNLRWDTKSANKADQIRHGRMPQLNREHCPGGHLYAGPNLYRYSSRRGEHRACQACRDAQNERQRQPADFDWRAWADERYALIMEGLRPPARPPGRPRKTA